MSECYKCSHMGYHGIRRDGWPSTMFMFCEDFGHNRPPNCTLFTEGEPHWFDKHGVEMTLDELNAIPNPYGGGVVA